MGPAWTQRSVRDFPESLSELDFRPFCLKILADDAWVGPVVSRLGVDGISVPEYMLHYVNEC